MPEKRAPYFKSFLADVECCWVLCISTMWLFNFFLVGRTSTQDKLVKETQGKGTRERGPWCPLRRPGRPASPPHPSSSNPSTLPPSPHHSPPSPPSPSSGGLKDPASSPAGTCMTGTGMSEVMQSPPQLFPLLCVLLRHLGQFPTYSQVSKYGYVSQES